jgi:hypothetical protein
LDRSPTSWRLFFIRVGVDDSQILNALRAAPLCRPDVAAASVRDFTKHLQQTPGNLLMAPVPTSFEAVAFTKGQCRSSLAVPLSTPIMPGCEP